MNSISNPVSLIEDLGGWDAESLEIPDSLEDQVEFAFKNIHLNLRHAGGKGCSQIYKVVSYHVGLKEEDIAIIDKAFGKWMPDHRPIWTMLGVERLAFPAMKIEIDVVADLGQ